VALDPVCGTPVQPHNAMRNGMIWYEGVPFYFCSLACKTSFDRDPKRFYKIPQQV